MRRRHFETVSHCLNSFLRSSAKYESRRRHTARCRVCEEVELDDALGLHVVDDDGNEYMLIATPDECIDGECDIDLDEPAVEILPVEDGELVDDPLVQMDEDEADVEDDELDTVTEVVEAARRHLARRGNVRMERRSMTRRIR